MNDNSKNLLNELNKKSFEDLNILHHDLKHSHKRIDRDTRDIAQSIYSMRVTIISELTRNLHEFSTLVLHVESYSDDEERAISEILKAAYHIAFKRFSDYLAVLARHNPGKGVELSEDEIPEDEKIENSDNKLSYEKLKNLITSGQ